MVRRLVRLAFLPVLLTGTALLGGCYVAPYPVAPRYAYAYPGAYYAPPYYHRGYWR